MNSKYRTYDYSTNIILNAKITTYAPYKSLKQKNNTSTKKMQPLHIKIFDKPKRNQRILSRNDRMDLFLEGGNFSQTRQLTSKSQVDRSFYKIGRIKKKQQIFSPLRSQVRTNGWQQPKNTSQNQNTKLIKSQYLNFVNIACDQTRKQIQVNNEQTDQQNFIHQKSVENVSITNHEISLKKVKKPSKDRERTQENITTTFYNRIEDVKANYKNLNHQLTMTKNSFNSENQLQKVNKMKRPLFYLEPKQISHIRADSFIVTEFPSGQIIFGNYFKKNGQIASLTKIMTFYAVYQISLKYSKNVSEQQVQIDEQAQSVTGTSAEIFVGDVYTVQQLFYGLMLPSGNDAATALAKWGGKILQQNDQNFKPENNEVKTFVKYMNFLAKNCGMKASKFCNPHGLPHPQSSSNAQDLSFLMHQCLKIQLFKTVIRTRRYNCWVQHNGIKHEVIWENTNKLLRRPNFIGGKTGVTVTAGPCLASCYEMGQKILVVILLRTNKLSRRFKQTRFILALAMNKLDKNLYKQKIKQIMKNDAELDSDNSDDEEEFNYQKSDAKQMTKRSKILTFEM